MFFIVLGSLCWCARQHLLVVVMSAKSADISCTNCTFLIFLSFALFTATQVLRYEKGQHYGVHHDYGADDVMLSCGPRILTFFLYLSGMHFVFLCVVCWVGIALRKYCVGNFFCDQLGPTKISVTT